MPALGRNYIIAGAGITGLTLALTLAKFGANVTVLERAEALQEFGAGIQVSPNARRILDRLGLSEALSLSSLEPLALDTYASGATKPLVSLELGPLMRERFGAPYAVMHRADLAEALYKATRRFANIDVLFGVRHWDARSDERGVAVDIERASGQTQTLRALALLGADGVHSQTRQAILGGPAAAFGGRVAWRTLVPFEAVAGQIAMDRVSVFFSSGHHLVCYPLPHRKQVNLAIFLPGSADKAQAFPSVRTRGGPIVALMNAAGDSWTPWPLHTVTTPIWHRGNIGIIGDAAHAMVPFQAQGAAMGIEDAAVLAPLLVESQGAEAALARFASLRQPRVAKISALSASNGRIFHMPWPLSLGRNMIMRLQGRRAHLRRLGWIYGHDVGNGPAHS
ncbi:MAG: FAD-dependent monooxygenase [Devosia sp.]|jgi:salicylate hydroxylase|uniref:FAD-dependent monooxygenase n=1 Tax=Devosia sp. TaxID=1871048 RepID=UPI0019EEAB83|nr:FAD-dependent monooxygenase [Devosia sp.]MBF0680217.1 FAD-dependent monooxygenase [Devosia sp.]